MAMCDDETDDNVIHGLPCQYAAAVFQFFRFKDGSGETWENSILIQLAGSDKIYEPLLSPVVRRLFGPPRASTKTTSTKKLKMDDISSGTDSDYAKYWIDWFLETKGNEYFCEVDEDYILDRFNLTGLNQEVSHYYSEAIDMITDNLESADLDEKVQDQIEKTARHLYGLIHARFVITTRGILKMLEKYKKAEFGRCPRVLCNLQPLLPVGLSDIPMTKTVKLYCPRCEDIYNPKSSRHAAIDGAYFGTTFPHVLFQMHPGCLPTKSTERYEPRIFGFRIHHIAEQHRWQDRAREQYLALIENKEKNNKNEKASSSTVENK